MGHAGSPPTGAGSYAEPERSQPERFRRGDGNAYAFVPRGGGDHFKDHRCAGEWITIELVKMALKVLSRSVRYDVPEQDLRINLSRMPAISKSRFVLNNVRRLS